MAYTKLEHQLIKTCEINGDEARLMIDMVFEAIAEMLMNGEDVRVANFGIFYPFFSKRSRRRHPLTGKIVDVPETVRIKFKGTNRIISKLSARLL